MIPEENYITYSLAAIISAVSLYALRDKKVFNRLILHPASVIHKKEYYRLISSALVHHDILHLILNLFMFYVFCSGLEESMPEPGRFGVLAIVGSSLLCGHLLSLFLYRRDITYSCAGASAIVFGCLCSFLIFNPFEKHLSIPMTGAIPNIYTALCYLAVMLIYSRKFNEGKVDYSIHLGGSVGGLLTTISMYPTLITNII